MFEHDAGPGVEAGGTPEECFVFGNERLADRVPGSVFGEVVAYELELVKVPVGKVG